MGQQIFVLLMIHDKIHKDTWIFPRKIKKRVKTVPRRASTKIVLLLCIKAGRYAASFYMYIRTYVCNLKSQAQITIRNGHNSCKCMIKMIIIYDDCTINDRRPNQVKKRSAPLPSSALTRTVASWLTFLLSRVIGTQWQGVTLFVW